MNPRPVDVDGLRLHAVEAGEGEPILLLHGWGACTPFWKETMAALAARGRVIAFDWPGFGDSEAPPGAPCTIDGYAALLGRVMDVLGLAAATLIGHSMGASIALTFALAHPERVRRIVSVCAPVDGPTAFPWTTVVLSWPILRWFAYVLSRVGWIRRLFTGRFTHAVPMYPEVLDAFGRASYPAVVETVRSMRRLDLAGRVAALRVPILVVAAENDRIVRPAQQDLLRAIPGATVRTYAHCGHCPPVEHPETFSRDAAAFLAAAQAVATDSAA